MALQHDITIDGGIVVPSAYVRLFGVDVERRGGGVIMNIRANVYRNRQARLDDPDGAAGYSLFVQTTDQAAIRDIFNTRNSIAAIYAFLKTQASLAGATDVIE